MDESYEKEILFFPVLGIDQLKSVIMIQKKKSNLIFYLKDWAKNNNSDNEY